MPLKFIFGPSGSGKSFHLYRHITEESLRHPERNYIVLVPEQFTMQTQKDLVMQHPKKGIMNIDVLSFARLAYRVFEETGKGALPVLDDMGKNLILRKVAAQCEGELRVLRGNMKKLGCISEVKSVISEFTQYDIGMEELERVMESAGEGSRLYWKLNDIRILYRGFSDYLEKKYITKEELLDVLSSVVGESEIIKNSTVALDGFTGFTPVQNRLLGELLRHSREVIVTVTIDDREDPYSFSDPYQMFALSKRMAASLVRLAKETGEELEEPLCLYGQPAYRFRGNPALAFLERNLFRHGTAGFGGRQDRLRLHAAGNPAQEAFAAAGRVRELVRKKGWRYRDIGVIVSSMDRYGDDLRRAFDEYDIPVFMDHKRSILLNPFVEYLRSLLNMAEQSFTYESVFRFLRTGLFGFSADETDALENYVIGLGIKGYKKWQERWVRRLPEMEEEELESLNHCRVMFVERVQDLLFVLRQKRKTVRDITLALYEFMVREKLQLRLKEQEEAFQVSGRAALAKEYAQIYRILVELFDRLVELLGDEAVSLKEYCELFDAGLEEARVGVIPPGSDQVVVGDVQRTRLKDIRALIFLGADDACLPGDLMRNGFLTEQDREQFAREKLALAPGGKEQAYVQKFYLYLNLTRPSEYLDVYYSRVSADGKSVRPSYLVQELIRLYPGLKAEDEEKRPLTERELTGEMAIELWIRGLRAFLETEEEKAGEAAAEKEAGETAAEKEAGEAAADEAAKEKKADRAWRELSAWYLRDPEWRKKILRLSEAGRCHRPSDRLSGQLARKLYGEHFQDSISRIERFDACAFSHFLTYGLGLKERETYEFEAVDLGNVCHRALERFSGRVEKEGVSWTKLPDEKRERFIRESMEEAITDYGNSVLYSSARNGALIGRMRQMLERTVWALTEQLAAGDFAPSDYEMRFENGKIDRVDTCEDENGVYVKVLDYKTGSKAFDVVSLYHGLQLQLMVYMDAALKRQKKWHPDKEVIPAGVFYYRIQDPLVEAEEDQIREKLLKELRPDGIVNLTGDSLAHLERKQAGDSFAIPVRFNKDGSLSRTSKAVSGEEFTLMTEHALSRVRRAHEEILNGKTDAVPYRRGQESACDYCPYRHVCGFDVKVPGYGYREIGRMSREEAFAAMRREAERKA